MSPLAQSLKEDQLKIDETDDVADVVDGNDVVAADDTSLMQLQSFLWNQVCLNY